MGVRIDKWLQIARILKSRARAREACRLGRVRCNGTSAKPHRTIRIGDRIEVDLPGWDRVLIVLGTPDRPVKKTEASSLYEDLSGPRPEPDPFEKLLRRPVAPRVAGAGRPTKQERRRLDKLKRR